MTYKTLGVGVALVLLGAVGAGAQDYFFPLYGAYKDHDVPMRSPDAPCVNDGGIWQFQVANFERVREITFLCANGGRLFTRRYFRPADNLGPVAQPVYLVPNPADLEHQQLPGGVVEACHVPGLVTGVYGGCVPADHPNARK